MTGTAKEEATGTGIALDEEITKSGVVGSQVETRMTGIGAHDERSRTEYLCQTSPTSIGGKSLRICLDSKVKQLFLLVN